MATASQPAPEVSISSPILILDRDAAVIARLLAEHTERPLLPVTDGLPEQSLEEIELCLGAPDRVAAHAARLPALRWVQSTWAGVGPLLPLARERPELVVTGVKGIFGPLMAEYVFGWLALLERGMLAHHAAQAERRWAPAPQRRLAGRRLVLLGLGSIGAHLAQVAGSFGIRVTGVSRSGLPVAGCEAVHPVDALETAVRGADYLVSVVPDTAETRGRIDGRVLGALAEGAILVNVGRGSVLVEEELLRCLREGPLRAAVLDVFREEPLPADHPFWTEPGVHVTPHVSAPTLPEDIAGLFLENLARWDAGEAPAHRVDPVRGY
jgi:phosphoglycerate dehydrogenase-like enzyme